MWRNKNSETTLRWRSSGDKNLHVFFTEIRKSASILCMTCIDDLRSVELPFTKGLKKAFYSEHIKSRRCTYSFPKRIFTIPAFGPFSNMFARLSLMPSQLSDREQWENSEASFNNN